MSGFRNCGSVTKFAVGMRVRPTCDGDWTTVIAVSPHGAHCLNGNDTVGWIGGSCVDLCELDLDSIWVGREYRNRQNHEVSVVVRMVQDGKVAYSYTATDCICGVPFFQRNYEPLPITEDKQDVTKFDSDPIREYLEQRKRDGGVVSVDRHGARLDGHVGWVDPDFTTFNLNTDMGEIGLNWTDPNTKVLIPAPKWQPQEKTHCGWKNGDSPVAKVYVRCIDGERAWVKLKMDEDGDPGEVVWVEDLCELPEPPVKVGDYCVLRHEPGDVLIAVGRVAEIKDNAFRLCLKDHWFLFEEYSITRLVPESR